MPISRHEALQPISREHHFGLLLCWKIRTGLEKNIDTGRISDYVKFAFQTSLQPHFRLEEDVVFTVLDEQDPLVLGALEQHRKLTQLITDKEPSTSVLEEIQTLLNEHIRFEERVLFQKIQDQATAEEFNAIVEAHSTHEERLDTDSVWKDEFWK